MVVGRRLRSSVAVVRDKAIVTADNRDLSGVVESPLAIGAVRESIVQVGATASKDQNAIVERHTAAQCGIGIGTHIDLERGEGAADAGAEVAVDNVEAALFLEARIVTEDDADAGVEGGLAADGWRGHGGRGGQEERSSAGDELHFVSLVFWLGLKMDSTQRREGDKGKSVVFVVGFAGFVVMGWREKNWAWRSS